MSKKTSSEIPVHIYFVLDRSGSMSSLRQSVVDGIKEFITEQKAQPGKCRLSMIQFDGQDPHEILYDAVKIEDVPLAGIEMFEPRGMTPLYDAEGWMINRAKQRSADRKAEGKKEEAVLFVTMTDGAENASREWNHTSVAEAKAACEKDGWTFSYLGANHDAYAQASAIGTNINAVQGYAGDAQGVKSVLASVSSATTGLRTAARRGRKGAVSSANLYSNEFNTGGKGGEEDAKAREKVVSS